MLNINNQIEAALLINGQDMPLAEGTFESIIINQNIALHVPMFKITLYDNRGVSETTRNLTDGSSIDVVLNSFGSEAEARLFNFRLFGIPKSKTGPGGSVTLTGILDCMKYFRSIANGGKRGTSSDAIRQIAADCELEYEGTNTDDSMFWLAGNTAYCKFARSIANHGYVDKNSIMALALTDTKLLRYVNLSDVIKQDPKAIMWQGTQPDKNDVPAFHVKNYEVKSQSGLLNNMFNYGAAMVGDTMDGIIQSLSRIRIPVLSNTLEINKEVKQKVGIVRQEFLPPESGNQHKNWNAAKNQNTRGEATFGMKIHVTVYEPCRLNIFDLVRLDLFDENGGNPSLNGEYIVTAKTRCIRGNIYIEKYELRGQGRANDAGANLLDDADFIPSRILG